MSTEQTHPPTVERRRSWLFDHIGRIVGLVGALVAFAFVALLAFDHYPPAEGLLVFLVVMFVMIGVGGRIHRL